MLDSFLVQAISIYQVLLSLLKPMTEWSFMINHPLACVLIVCIVIV